MKDSAFHHVREGCIRSKQTRMGESRVCLVQFVCIDDWYGFVPTKQPISSG